MQISKIDKTISKIDLMKWSIAKYTHMYHWYNSGEYDKVLRIFELKPNLRCIAYNRNHSEWIGNNKTCKVSPINGGWHENEFIRNDGLGNTIITMTNAECWIRLDFTKVEDLEPDVTEELWYYYCFANPKYHWLPMLRKQFLRKE